MELTLHYYFLYFLYNRCVDIGKYAMIGTSVRTCVREEWTGQKPSCFGLNQENDYASKNKRGGSESTLPNDLIFSGETANDSDPAPERTDRAE